MALSADLLRGYTDTIILKQLSNSDSYGYRISKAVAEQSGGVLRARVSASCTESLDVLCSRFDGLTAEHDEDGLWHLTWTLPEVTA